MHHSPAPTVAPIPRGVWLLGLVSLCMDLSSELIHSILPLFIVTTLGASPMVLGLLEGLAEATAALVKAASGGLSDWLGRRKPLVLLGYGLSALTKPLFPLASSIGMVFTARLLDRVGKGIRGAPRDALLTDLTPATLRGAGFGLRQSLDSIGALLGPLLAMGLLACFTDDVRLVLWVAVVPALLAVLLLLAVKEPPQPASAPEPPVKDTAPTGRWRALPTAFWAVTGFALLLTLARFSEAFLLLRGNSLGLPIAWAPAVMVAMNLAYVLSSYPAGRLSDRIGRRRLVAMGCLLLLAADAMLALADGGWLLFGGALLWGMHMGLTEGVLSAMVADTAPAALRGTAFGLFRLTTGIALLAASLIAGALWEWVGPAATFMAGALCTALALLVLLRLRPGAG